MVVGADAVRGDDEENVLSGPGRRERGCRHRGPCRWNGASSRGSRGPGAGRRRSCVHLATGRGRHPVPLQQGRPAPRMGRHISRASCSHHMITPVRNKLHPQSCRRTMFILIDPFDTCPRRTGRCLSEELSASEDRSTGNTGSGCFNAPSTRSLSLIHRSVLRFLPELHLLPNRQRYHGREDTRRSTYSSLAATKFATTAKSLNLLRFRWDRTPRTTQYCDRTSPRRPDEMRRWKVGLRALTVFHTRTPQTNGTTTVRMNCIAKTQGHHPGADRRFTPAA